MLRFHLPRGVLPVLAALAAGALGGYLAALVRPRTPRAYASDYHAPHPDAVALPAATEPAVSTARAGGAGAVR